MLHKVIIVRLWNTVPKRLIYVKKSLDLNLLMLLIHIILLVLFISIRKIFILQWSIFLRLLVFMRNY